MKKLLIPVIIAVLAGVGGGSGFAYMRASKQYVADSTHMADSLKAHPAEKSDSSAAHEGEAAVAHVDSAPVIEPPPMTPADSIRALEATRGALHESTKGLPDAKATANALANAAAKTPEVKPVDAKAEAAKPISKIAEPKTADAKPAEAKRVDAKATDGKASSTSSVANVVRDARNEALNTALPEQRLAKIFSAMSAKDAAKVMEQMPDIDVRTILGLMNDKTAASILSQFPAPRAAAITKGSVRAAGTTP